MPAFDWSAVRFGAPDYLWLLAVPAVLLLLWAWQLTRRWRMVSSVLRRRASPGQRPLPRTGDLLFWLLLLAAMATGIVALARPRAVTGLVRSGGVDLVILQDGSASMHVQDASPLTVVQPGRPAARRTRWQRSMLFLRELGESIRWQGDRVALALFAHIATPQIRLTRDPNTLFFFLDHLEQAPPYPLDDDASWDTNIERGIYWGLRVIDKDEEIQGPSANAKAFVLLSDGQAWTGQVARSVELARARRIPIHVVGVGSTTGGVIPDPLRVGGSGPPPIVSVLDRQSLGAIATAGGGDYFEIGQASDREVATAIIDATRRRAGSGTVEETAQELYWPALVVAVILAALGVLFLRQPPQLVLQAVAAAVLLAAIAAFAAR